MSTTLFEAFELENTVNYPVNIEQRTSVSHEISQADQCLFWLVHLTEHKVLL